MPLEIKCTEVESGTPVDHLQDGTVFCYGGDFYILMQDKVGMEAGISEALNLRNFLVTEFPLTARVDVMDAELNISVSKDVLKHTC